MSIEKIEATPNKKMIFDDAGFFVIFIDNDRQEIVAEFYENVTKGNNKKGVDTGRIKGIITGESAKAMTQTIIRNGLVTRLDHSAYLGRELQKAEDALKNRKEYVQDEPLVW